MKKLVIKLIEIYQIIPGPWHNHCRFYPTCSNYAKEAILKHGLKKGLKLAIKRILKCRPGKNLGGIDLVPPK